MNMIHIVDKFKVALSSKTFYPISPKANKELNEKEIFQKKTKIDSLPLIAEISTTDVCNINPPCVMCWKHIDPNHGYINKDAHHIPKQYLMHLAPYVSGASEISLHGIGEPLTCDYLFEVTKSITPETKVKFSSNGLLLNEKNIEKILNHNVTSINFSLDAATPETYRKIRHNDLNKTINNIKNLAKRRDEAGKKFPKIQINMCLMLENMHEVPAFLKLGKYLGASKVLLFHLNQGADYKYEWFDYKQQHCRLKPKEHDEYIRQGYGISEELGIDLVLNGKRYFMDQNDDCFYYNRKLELNHFWCSKPWDSILVGVNGDVFNCCYQTQAIGTLKDNSFEQIWNGNLLQKIRKSTLKNTPHPICNNKNNPCPYLGRE